eukprot:TRINITY_DN38793_c0_g1_i13.p2 TRINITY_DN38793_c0_g1~~TRINITY_DN38793_c0_g1_i13.p2  ORF type:complete len:342 (-),score=46.57 TRINITY_DN38793_c0_g1_i13:198-1133(-)
MELKVKYEDLLLANEHIPYPSPGLKLKIPCKPEKDKEQQQESNHSEDETPRQQKKYRNETFPTLFDAPQDTYSYDEIDIDDEDSDEHGDEVVSSFVIYDSPSLPIPSGLVEMDHSRAIMRELEVPVYVDQFVDGGEVLNTDSEGACSEDALILLDDLIMINDEVTRCTNYARTNPEGFQQQLGDCFREFVSPRQPLIITDLLVLSASQHSADLAQNNIISHFGSDGSTVAERVDRTGYEFQLVGENVLFNRFYNASALDLVGQWWCSEGHYQNMVGCRYSEIGISVVIGSTGYFATQHLGCPMQQGDCNSC